jgi:hypothetical protein
MTTGRLAVLSNVNVNMVIRMLQKNAQVYESEGYGNELGTLLNPQSSYHAYHAEITFLIMDLAELLEHDLDPVTAEQKIGNWFRTLEGCLPQEGVFYVSDAYLWAVELAVLADTGRKNTHQFGISFFIIQQNLQRIIGGSIIHTEDLIIIQSPDGLSHQAVQTVIQFSLCRHIIDGYDDTQLFTHTVPRSTFALPSSTR